MEITKNILGFIAAAVATFLLFISMCIVGVSNGGVMVRYYKLSRKSNSLGNQESFSLKPLTRH